VTLIKLKKKLEPVVGFEPTTDGLQNRCSTTELNWLNHNKNKHLRAVFDLLRFLQETFKRQRIKPLQANETEKEANFRFRFQMAKGLYPHLSYRSSCLHR
jgi:hypothetical protein